MPNHNLRESLHSLAQDAPDISGLRTSLVPRIRHRRRTRQSLTVLGVVAATGALTTGVIMGATSIGPNDSGPATSAATGLTIGGCGSPVTGQARTDLPLRITAAIPEGSLRADDPHPQVNTTVTNESSSVLRIKTSRSADLAVVKDGVVVRPPGGQRDVARVFTLEAGATRTYPAFVNMLRCDPGDSSSAPVSLEPGTYQLYAMQQFAIIGEGGQEEAVLAVLNVQGGPWDVQIAP